MPSDLRLDFSFKDHLKRKRLYRLAGPRGVLALLDLWLYAGENYPTGTLWGMSAADIASASNFSGNAEKFISALLESGFLECKEKDGKTIFSLHNWDIRQPFIFNSEEKSRKNRHAAECRWQSEKEKTQCIMHTTCNAPTYLPTYLPTNLPTIPTKPKDKNTLSELSEEQKSSDAECIEILKILTAKIKNYRPNHKIMPEIKALKIIKLMLTADKREPTMIKEILAWYPIGEPYIPEIFSARSLREKYDSLESAYCRKNKSTTITKSKEEIAKDNYRAYLERKKNILETEEAAKKMFGE